MSDSEVQDILVEYETHLQDSGLSPATVKSYLADIRHFASWLERTRAKPLLGSSEEDVRGYCVELATEKAHPPATVNRRLQSIRKFYRYALDCGLVKEDPSAGIKLLPQSRSKAATGLTRAEVRRLLEAVRRGPAGFVKRDYAILQLMLQTGIRVGELTRLKVSDVMLSNDEGILRIRGYGASQSREIPLNSSVRGAVSAYLEERSSSGGDPLFLSRKGQTLSARSVQRLVSTYGRAAGLGKVSTYTLRQTYGEHLLRDTGDLSLVARLMGHKRLETAIKYVLPRQEERTEVAESGSLDLG